MILCLEMGKGCPVVSLGSSSFGVKDVECLIYFLSWTIRWIQKLLLASIYYYIDDHEDCDGGTRFFGGKHCACLYLDSILVIDY